MLTVGAVWALPFPSLGILGHFKVGLFRNRMKIKILVKIWNFSKKTGLGTIRRILFRATPIRRGLEFSQQQFLKNP